MQEDRSHSIPTCKWFRMIRNKVIRSSGILLGIGKLFILFEARHLLVLVPRTAFVRNTVLAKSSERSLARTDRLHQEATGKQLENILRKGTSQTRQSLM